MARYEINFLHRKFTFDLDEPAQFIVAARLRDNRVMILEVDLPNEEVKFYTYCHELITSEEFYMPYEDRMYRYNNGEYKPMTEEELAICKTFLERDYE